MEKDVELVEALACENRSSDSQVEERRALLARSYSALPPYGSLDFWRAIEGQLAHISPVRLEILVMAFREALRRVDISAQRRIFEIILLRLQISNERWIEHALKDVSLSVGEPDTLVADMYADLCVLLLRALRDPRQHFWQESFLHSLSFARKHVYEDLLRREGFCFKRTPGPGRRVPQTLLESLESIDWDSEEEHGSKWNVFDEQAEKALEAVELADLTELVAALPSPLRVVVWLIFWEDCQVQTVSQILHISTRMVRYRLQDALTRLRKAFLIE